MRAMLGGNEPKIPRVDGGENGGLDFLAWHANNKKIGLERSTL